MKYKLSLPIRILKSWVRFLHNKIFYRHFIVVGGENVPPDGTPTLIPSNHQSCMLDPLGILFAMDHHAKFMTRGDIFKKPLLNKLLRAIGLLPVFRMGWDGLDAVRDNNKSFDECENELISGRHIVIFPEGMHQDIHTLGEFSHGYTKLAFDAAKRANFEKDVFIQPCVNHYSNYWHMRADLVIKFGEPLNLRDYYELYQTKPRTAQREVNKVIHQRMSDLMLDVRDTANYEAIDYIRETYGKDYARKHGADPKKLDQKLVTDKALVAKLESISAEKPDMMKAIYDETISLKKATELLGVRDWVIAQNVAFFSVFVRILGLILLFPAFFVGLFPNLFVYLLPNLITKSLKDKMFSASIYLGISVVSIPLLSILTFFIVWGITSCWIAALVYTALIIPLGLLAWGYRKGYIKTRGLLRWALTNDQTKNKITTLRKNLFTQLDELIEK